jgi:acetyl/propionyl-CoA carboxylase alpha subunit
MVLGLKNTKQFFQRIPYKGFHTKVIDVCKAYSDIQIQKITPSLFKNRSDVFNARKECIMDLARGYNGEKPGCYPNIRSESELFSPDGMELDARWYAHQLSQGYTRFQTAVIPNRSLKAADMQKAAESFGLYSFMLQHPHDIVDTTAHQGATYVQTIVDYMNAKAVIEQIEYVQQFDPRTVCIFPATGFLAETTDYHDAIKGTDILFGGASATAMKLMGDKQQAQLFLESLWDELSENDKERIGNPPLMPSMVVDPNSPSSIQNAKDFISMNGASMVKASGGGGGAGIEEVKDPNQLEKVVKNISAIADQLFPGSVIKLEKKIQNSRHIESQGMVAGDSGFILNQEPATVMNLGDRDCSLQHNRAKRLEEQSFAVPDEDLQKKNHFILKVLEKLKELGYQGPITMEFLYDGAFYFMEANTRIQIEHPVSGMAYGDPNLIAKLMIAAALDHPYEIPSKKDGHVGYARIYAEDEKMNPSYEGHVESISLPETDENSFVKIAVKEGAQIRRMFNTQIGEVGVWAPTRKEVIQKLEHLLSQITVKGIKLNINNQLALMSTNEFQTGEFKTDTFEKDIFPKIVK